MSLEKRDVTAILLVLIGGAVIVFMDAIAKELVKTMPVFQVVATRSWIIIGLMLAWLPRMGGVAALKTRRLGGHVLRSMGTAGSVALYFTGLRFIPLADAVVIFFAAPFFILILAILFFGEKVGVHRWSAVAIGFVGVIVAMSPGPGLVQPASLLIVASALGYAFAMMMSRRLGATESIFSLIFYQNLGNVLFTTPFALAVWTPMPLRELALLLVLVVTALVGFYCLTRAYATGTSSLIAPFEYSSLVWAALFGYLMFGDIPGPTVWVGALLVILGGLYLLHRERKIRSRGKAA